MAKTRTHTWRDIHFEPSVQADGDIRTADDLVAIRQSIVSILTTKKGERVMLPEFGSNVWAILFEPIDDITTDRLRDAIAGGIRRWEPRVELGLVKVVPREDRNEYEISIAYSIRGLAIAGSQSLNINLKRG